MTACLQRFSYLLITVPEGDVPAPTLYDITKWRLLELDPASKGKRCQSDFGIIWDF